MSHEEKPSKEEIARAARFLLARSLVKNASPVEEIDALAALLCETRNAAKKKDDPQPEQETE